MSEILTPTPHIVAYIDLLGVKNIIKSEGSNKTLGMINELYDIVERHTKNESFLEVMSDFAFRAFSDNFIISVPLTDDERENHNRFLILCQYLSATQLMYLMHPNVLLRGGITIGDYFINERIVWGNALLRGYELESKIAVYPRIVVDNNNVIIKDFFDRYYDEIVPELFCRDKDGRTFINCFTEKTSEMIHNAPEDYPLSVKNIIKNNIKECSNDERAKQKWIWTDNQYESCWKCFKDIDK